MTQFFENENMINENTCEVFMNDVMEEQCEIRMWNKPQSSNINQPKSKNEEKTMKENIFKMLLFKEQLGNHMITKMLMWNAFKPWDVFIVIIV
jgi:hypothetical protein